MAKILVLGNDPQINSIRFDQLNPKIVTLGVNRIWLKHIPKYFFFNDLIISNELAATPNVLDELKRSSIIFSSDWLYKNKKNKVPDWTTIYQRKNKMLFPDSVSTSITLCNSQYLPNSTYYIAGVSLKWKNPSHFWKKSNAVSKVGPEWYLPRFERMKANFQYLKATGINMISVNPDSELNKFLRYESIENLYVK
jgi:hypothetical protein